MKPSLGLMLYTLAARRRPAALPPWPDRPRGPLIWLHAPDSGAARTLQELARRLVEDAGHPVLLTCPEPLSPQRGVALFAPPEDTPGVARAFLDHWKPAAAVFADGELRPAVLQELYARSVPVAVVDARVPHILRDRWGWWPGLSRYLLSQLTAVVAVDPAAARQWRKAGVPAARLRGDGRMEEGAGALRCNEAERSALVRQFRTRPVWLAAALPEAEEAAVITAHRAALRLSHRLLLIIVPDSANRSDALARHMSEAEGWTVARRAADEEPDEETEVYLADNTLEFGLWYRLAPITFLGGSLYGAGAIRDPFEPAALGSAILLGPRPGPWTGPIARLTNARAARAITGPADLAEALADLLSPDRAARLAQGAWAVASAGAEVTDRVIAMLREMTGGAA